MTMKRLAIVACVFLLAAGRPFGQQQEGERFRFRTGVEPDSDEVVKAIEAELAK